MSGYYEAKADKGKVRFSLVPPKAFVRLCLDEDVIRAQWALYWLAQEDVEPGPDTFEGTLLHACRCIVTRAPLHGIAEVLEFGAQKYAAHSWQKVPDGVLRYGDALLRHALDGPTHIDPESGLPSVWHMGCCASFLIELLS